MYTPENTSLCLDVMLGGLTAPLRMMGYDTAYALDRGVEDDGGIIELARRENRLLLTRDRQLAEQVDSALLISETATDEQLATLAAAGFDLSLTEPTRCSRCNGGLVRVEHGPGPKAGPDPNDEPVWQCRNCGQYYWKGSHWEDMQTRLRGL